jgi:hypothetical protein
MSKLTGLIASMVFAGSAAAENVGDWAYQAQRSFYAATVNDSGNVFGQWCDVSEGTCMYLVAFPVACREDANYPVLANADSGVEQVMVACKGALDSRNAEGRQLYRYAFSDFARIDALVRNSRRIGIAMPMEADQFRVFRFSLSGALPALTSMRGAAERAAAGGGGGRQNTRDLRL